MPSNDLNADTKKSDLVYLLKEVKLISPFIGSYIEHFQYTDHVIIVKLTNGFIKIEQNILEKHQNGSEALNQQDLKAIADTFDRTLL